MHKVEDILFSLTKSTEDTAITVQTWPTTFMVWVSIVSGLLAVVAGLAFWELREGSVTVGRESRAKAFAWTNVFATVGNLVLVVACTIVVFLAQKGDGTPNLEQMHGGFDVHWTRETIMCSAKKIDGNSWAKSGCAFAVCLRHVLCPRKMRANK